MKQTADCPTEAELEGLMEWECRRRGAQRLAYPPVVASGISANTLHYINNDSPLRAGEMVLVDAGGELECYASDITRTWPISGHFTPGQRRLYEEVLLVQERCIDFIRKESGVTLERLHRFSCEATTEALLRLGLLPARQAHYEVSHLAHNLHVRTLLAPTLTSSGLSPVLPPLHWALPRDGYPRHLLHWEGCGAPTWHGRDG